jgi:hypothetical protein
MRNRAAEGKRKLTRQGKGVPRPRTLTQASASSERVRLNATLDRKVAIEAERMLTDYYESTGTKLSLSAVLDAILGNLTRRKDRIDALRSVMERRPKANG